MLSEEDQVSRIKETIAEFKDRLDGNAWVQAVLEGY